jgi:hypothetical protein
LVQLLVLTVAWDRPDAFAAGSVTERAFFWHEHGGEKQVQVVSPKFHEIGAHVGERETISSLDWLTSEQVSRV